MQKISLAMSKHNGASTIEKEENNSRKSTNILIIKKYQVYNIIL